MSNSKIAKIRQELEIIRKNNKGLLNPEDVVEFAKNKNTALHKSFEWDDKKASAAYRIAQAEGIIRRVKVTIVNKQKEEVKVRCYVSLPEDRGSKSDGKGNYRHIDSVISEKDLRIQFLESVQSEFESFRLKLRNISGVLDSHAEKISIEIEKEIKKQRKKKAS